MKLVVYLDTVIHHHKGTAPGNGRLVRIQFNFYELELFPVDPVIDLVIIAHSE